MIYVSDIAFLDSQYGWGIDEMRRTIKKSTSGGQRWITTSYPMNGERLVGMDVDKASGTVWVLSDKHAWASRDLGLSWTKTTLVPAGDMLGIVFADSVRGWAVSRNGIVQELTRDPFVVSAAPAPAPGEAELQAPWPNPMSGVVDAVHIPFRLTRHGPIRISIVNSAGKEVAVAAEDHYHAGSHVASWSPDGFSNGMYFITMKTGAGTFTRSMVIAR
jgi:hypothetical protein